MLFLFLCIIMSSVISGPFKFSNNNLSHHLLCMQLASKYTYLSVICMLLYMCSYLTYFIWQVCTFSMICISQANLNQGMIFISFIHFLCSKLNIFGVSKKLSQSWLCDHCGQKSGVIKIWQSKTIPKRGNEESPKVEQ